MSKDFKEYLLEQIEEYKKLSDERIVKLHYEQHSGPYPMQILIKALDSEIKRRKIKYTVEVSLKIEKQ